MTDNLRDRWIWKPAKIWQFWLPGSGYTGGLLLGAVGVWFMNLIYWVLL